MYRLLNLNECWIDDSSHVRPVGGLLKGDGNTDSNSVHSDTNVSYMKFTTKPVQRTSSSGTDSGVGLTDKESQKHIQPRDTHRRPAQHTADRVEGAELPPDCYESSSNVYSMQTAGIVDNELHRLSYLHGSSNDITSRSISRTSRCSIQSNYSIINCII